MTREIKFRAKIAHGENAGKWKYVVVGEDAIGTAFSEKSIYFNNEDCIKSTLGQFTGFKDKNGTEIYEGDLVKLSSGFSPDVRPVIFNGCSWYIGEMGISFAQMYANGKIQCEVIGNIYKTCTH